MVESRQIVTGTAYTAPVALSVAGLVVIPAFLLFSGPLGYVSVSLAVAGSAVCMTLARIFWVRFSRLSIPSISAPDGPGAVDSRIP